MIIRRGFNLPFGAKSTLQGMNSSSFLSVKSIDFQRKIKCICLILLIVLFLLLLFRVLKKAIARITKYFFTKVDEQAQIIEQKLREQMNSRLDEIDRNLRAKIDELNSEIDKKFHNSYEIISSISERIGRLEIEMQNTIYEHLHIINDELKYDFSYGLNSMADYLLNEMRIRLREIHSDLLERAYQGLRLIENDLQREMEFSLSSMFDNLMDRSATQGQTPHTESSPEEDESQRETEASSPDTTQREGTD
ncbi:hypothetical protein [Candidatus Similichlamydia epinepheli]|uniref:hypothetical protein n=1 Tax=Candidatus Similichlamydia epinepheli TaxID=1903953 RepID=UPI000D33DCDD|nr:hypothetical protein [Candidatus Similichlamydia epinepheli]